MKRLRRIFNRQPIARKLAWITAGTTAVGLHLLAFSVVAYELLSYPARVRGELQTMATLVGTNSRSALLFGDRRRAGEALESFRTTPAVTQAFLLTEDGDVIASYLREPGNQRGPHDIVIESPIVFDGNPLGAIRIVCEPAEVWSRAGRYLVLVSTVMILVLVLVVLLTAGIRRLISEPLLSLAGAARALSERDYSVRATKISDDEIGVLTDAFNHMVEEVSSQTRSLLQANSELEEARQRADAASLAKARFLANMSHEIRTPMNGIMGTIALAMDTPLNAEQTEYLRTVHDSADSLLALLDGVLDLSKIEAGKLTLEEIDFDLASVLEDSHRMLALNAHQKGLEIAWLLDPAVPRIVRGDPTRLRQILINLLSNAVKFTRSGEVVTIVSLAGRGQGTAVRFSIRDTGIGISPSQQARILEAFEQADGSTTRLYGGTGLGLSICKKLAELMGGEISIESTEGLGSTFSFTAHFLPAHSAAGNQPAPIAAGLQALVVEDNPSAARGVAGLLERAGFAVTAAGDAFEALDRALEPFAIVLADISLPGMDGFRLAEELRRRPDFHAPVLLMLSTVDLAHRTARRGECGIAGHVTKPVSESRLLEAVESALSLRRRDAAPHSAGVQAEPGRTGRILVAEDNAVNQKVVASLIRKQGHHVTVVSNGAEAVVQVLGGGFDLVLMDLQMPVMDGIAATLEIRRAEKERGLARTPIVALTAHAFATDIDSCTAAGMDGHLPKPVRPDQLSAAIAASLDHVAAC